MSENKILLQLNNAGVSINRKIKLQKINLSVYQGDLVGIYGLNGSGKSLLAEILGGGLVPSEGKYIPSPKLLQAVVSSAEQKRMLEEERYNDDSEFMEGKTDPGRSVKEILKEAEDDRINLSDVRRLVGLFNIRHILDRGIKFLSTGEFRKMMIVRALLYAPDILVLDDPYTGLDMKSRTELKAQLPFLRNEVKAVIIISGRLGDIKEAERFFYLDKMCLYASEKTEDINEHFQNTNRFDFTGIKALQHEIGKELNELIDMHAVKMSYYDQKVLTGIDWTVYSGEHWQIIGPNGSGKSSLLSLVTGDSPKAYGQDIRLFGRLRGSGETVWEIKQKIGYVSGSIQQQHRISQTVISVVVSGFFDSIGLYDKPNPVQLIKAREWCECFGISSIIEKPFNSLSEGMKRAVLIVRAIVKQPELLILDEPCQGLDDLNSDFVLQVSRLVIANDHSTLLYVSHDPVYRMEEITNVLELVPHLGGGYTRKTVDEPCD